MADRVGKMASQNPVVIFSRSNCYMSHTVKVLFYNLGVNSAVHELDEIPTGKEIEEALASRGCNPTVPVVFIGGVFVGGADEVTSLHLSGSLIPMLKRAGALWL